MLHRFQARDSRTLVLSLSCLMVGAIAIADWLIKPYISLGFLYLFPIMFAAAFLPRWATVLAGIFCAALSGAFSGLPMSWVREGFEATALAGCGLFAGEISRTRRISVVAEEKMQTLIETSPAAILTVDQRGLIVLANRAAVELLQPREENLVGVPIAAFVPELHYALRLDDGPQLRSMLTSQARRGNGETFTADVWFSTYLGGGAPMLAAIIADVSEEAVLQAESAGIASPLVRAEINLRETEVLRLVVQGAANKQIADRMQLSESTVKATLQQLFSKTGVRTRAQLVRVALEQYRDLI